MRKNNKQSGLVLWFTGLSQSGKSTTADKVYEILKQKGLKTERLDGDIVRQSLTKDLGFSKEDRDKNIERVTFVAKLLARNGVIVLASFISPYRQRRRKTRKEIEESAKFVEVFCSSLRCFVGVRLKSAKNATLKDYTKRLAGVKLKTLLAFPTLTKNQKTRK